MTAPRVTPVGIDLGTTFSVVACLDAQGQPRTIPNSEGDLITPSVVFFDRTGVIVGKEAAKASVLEPDRSAVCAKRDIGSPTYAKTIHGFDLPPEVVEACVLRKLKADAEMSIGPFSQVVITVPAYFNEPRRKATQDAGRLADLEVLDIINEPTAAAISYGVRQGFIGAGGETPATEKILVYDLGGGTFDVTLMEIEKRHYKTIATAGDVYLGGMDWDQRIVDHLAEKYQEKFKTDLRRDPSALIKLQRDAEDAKRALSARTDVTVTVEHQGQGMRIPLSRTTFEEITADLVERTRFTTNRVLKDAGWNWLSLTRLLIVGGSSRMPMIRKMLEQESGHALDTSLSADEAVAHGAALYAGFLLQNNSNIDKSGVQFTSTVGAITNVNSHDLGVLGIEPETGRPRTKVLIPRNTPLPASRSRHFATRKENQDSLAIKVVEGGDASGNNATLIGKFVVNDLPAGLPAATSIEITFEYEKNGRLTVAARLPKIGHEAALVIERPSGLDDETMAQWKELLDLGLILDDAPPEDEADISVLDDEGESVFDGEPDMAVREGQEADDLDDEEEPSASKEDSGLADFFKKSGK